ncbi:tail fiber domain-containing protein [Emticicia sp. C21]|uniref:tail fiber domain-containing protein n=1 Tax=Emticicia sp. C21 TaxID=2302915 RepID=UPI000E355317|nr:tail fiber domain-containing protein [Emticicia sp. C21]RFS13322.1 hypothetical protein D0T08_27155 [Emticicia sp. C21]
MKKLHTFLLLLTTGIAFAQNTDIRPGLVLPQMATAQRTAIPSPVNGSLIFDTGTQSYWYRQSGSWVELSKSGSTANYWQLSGLAGNEIRNTNSGGFWSKYPVGLTDNADLTSHPPTAPVNEAGTRLMWIPGRSAFRAGTVTTNNGNKWAADNIGLFSFATGFDTEASGRYATATGLYTNANGAGSTAMGSFSVATGYASTAIGYRTTVGVSGYYATALGYETTANGEYAIAIGAESTASGNYAMAIGRKVNTNGQAGSVIMGDADPMGMGETIVGTTNQFVGRFYNGYYLLTSGDNNRTGATMGRGQSAWSAISDSTRKEKIVLADGESFLLKLRNLRLGSWNYKKQGVNPERFYGPMAQEIFAAFGNDKYGTIGNDTTVSTLNMDGLLFIFSQALEKRTQDLQVENQQLKAIIQTLDARLESLEAKQMTSNSISKSPAQTDK